MTASVKPPALTDLLYEVEDGGPVCDDWGRPTYRRRLNFIVLNLAPTENITHGLVVDYIKWALPLMGDDQCIESQYARIIQELVVLDVAVSVTQEIYKLDAAELIGAANAMQSRLVAIVNSSVSPRRMQLVPATPFARDWRMR